MRTLNGWQRLWIVSAACYAPFVLLYVFIEMPTREKVEGAWVYEGVEAHRGTPEPGQPYESHSDIRRQLFGSADDAGVILQLQNTRSNSEHNARKYEEVAAGSSIGQRVRDHGARLGEIEREFTARLSSLRYDQLMFLGGASLIWALPLLTLYLLGVAAGWVYDGFRPGRG